MFARVLLGFGILALAAVIAGVKYSIWGAHPDTVVVPTLSSDVSEAFDHLRDRGLRVAIPNSVHFRATSPPSAVRQKPRAGTRVPWGSVVQLRVTPGVIGSPAGPKTLPVYRVPDLVGKSLSDGVRWTRGKVVFWQTELPPLPPSGANHLFDAYVITAEHPTPGAELRLWRRIPHGVHLTPLVFHVALR